MWALIRGATPVKQPDAADLGRRYTELLAENLDQPRFRELVIVAHDVDTHRDLHLAVALDRLGRRLGSLELTVDERGFARLVRFARSLGEPAFAVEGTGSYGASLARGRRDGVR